MSLNQVDEKQPIIDDQQEDNQPIIVQLDTEKESIGLSVN